MWRQACGAVEYGGKGDDRSPRYRYPASHDLAVGLVLQTERYFMSANGRPVRRRASGTYLALCYCRLTPFVADAELLERIERVDQGMDGEIDPEDFIVLMSGKKVRLARCMSGSSLRLYPCAEGHPCDVLDVEAALLRYHLTPDLAVVWNVRLRWHHHPREAEPSAVSLWPDVLSPRLAG
jgi:hypothetical protein